MLQLQRNILHAAKLTEMTVGMKKCPVSFVFVTHSVKKFFSFRLHRAAVFYAKYPNFITLFSSKFRVMSRIVMCV